MLSKILFPTDFSEFAAKAEAFICGLSEAGAREIVLLNVVNQRIFDDLETHSLVLFHIGRFRQDPDEVKNSIIEERTNKLASIENRLQNAGFKVNSQVRVGSPSREILKIAEEENVSFVVMGSHGRGNISDMLIGSVAEKVVRRSTVNVIVIKR